METEHSNKMKPQQTKANNYDNQNGDDEWNNYNTNSALSKKQKNVKKLEIEVDNHDEWDLEDRPKLDASVKSILEQKAIQKSERQRGIELSQIVTDREHQDFNDKPKRKEKHQVNTIGLPPINPKVKAYQDQIYPVMNPVFNESFQRKMNDPHYDSNEEDQQELRSDNSQEMYFHQDQQNLETDRDIFRLDSDRNLVDDAAKEKSQISSNGKTIKSTKGSTLNRSQRSRNEAESSFVKFHEGTSLLSRSTIRKGDTYNFEEELKRLQTIDKIEKKLKKSGTQPEILLESNPKRGFLDSIKIPRKIRCKNTRCRYFDIKFSFLFCVFIVIMIDLVISVLHFFQWIEMFTYKHDYPKVVAIDNMVKFAMCFTMFLIEWQLILKRYWFNFCKLTYALKLIQILYVCIESIFSREVMEKQCSVWLANPKNGLKRDSSDISRNRPLTMVLYCTFERVLEDKESMETAETIHYYQFNNILATILITAEVIYCLGCMLLFLMIIYWNHQDREDVILGRDDQYESDMGESDEEEPDPSELNFHKENRKMMAKYISIRDEYLDLSRAKNQGSFATYRSKQNYLNKDRSFDRHSRRMQQSMRIDSMHTGPPLSEEMKNLNITVQEDKRRKLYDKAQDVHTSLHDFGNLHALNSSRHK